MKKYFICILISILFVVISCSKNSLVMLRNRVFIESDSLSINSLNFVNDSICIYTQEFFFNMNEEYKKTEIKCFYKMDKNKLILTNIDCPIYLIGLSCFVLPDSIRNIYVSKFVTSRSPRLQTDQLLIAYSYGYINGIKNSDTLTFYKNNIFYAKSTKCLFPGTIVGVKHLYREVGKELTNQKRINRFMSSKRMITNME